MPSIEEVMKTELVTVRPDTPLRDAVRLLIEHHISGLPVTLDDGTLVGVLSEKDVLKLVNSR